ncbi:MAG: vitamin B12-dependent ribonucleotide reductase, partial [Candidatus Nealsonbacteria bacterium]|nr:vitamin B12-dependent ribonucleotide reductase [Candidatus Nealsonbacteria bacterium]
YGVPLEVYVNKFSHTRFEPMGYTKNPDVKIAKSIVDYIFRWLGITFLAAQETGGKQGAPSSEPPSEEDAESQQRPAAMTAGGPNARQEATKTAAPTASNGNGNGNGNGVKKAMAAAAVLDSRVELTSQLEAAVEANRQRQFGDFQSDAPSCDNCGAITVRCGNCYLCYNCGQSMGCS